MTTLEKAQKQLESIGISTIIENDSLYVFTEDVQLELSDFEVKYRAKVYKEELYTAKLEESHVDEQILAQTGGYCMVDYFRLSDGTTLGVNDESVVLSYNDFDDEYDEDKDIGFIDISRIAMQYNGLIEYPRPTPYHRTIDGSKDLTGHYILSHEVLSKDGIIKYDYITMRNGVVIVIDDAQITVFTDDSERELIDTIERPCQQN